MESKGKNEKRENRDRNSREPGRSPLPDRRRIIVLYLGDEMEVGVPWDSGPALARFQESTATLGDFKYDCVEAVPLDEVEAAFRRLHEDLHRRYPSVVMRRLKPIEVEIP